MDKDKPLTFMDYWKTPVKELTKHPEFSQHAFNVVNSITYLTTKELEKIDIVKLKENINNGR